jgi:hypothetical protein
MAAPDATISGWSKLAPRLLGVVCVWLVLCGIALFELGLWPRTVVGWVVTFTLGPVASVTFMVAGELAVKLLLRMPWVRRSHEWVERGTSRSRVCWLRVGYALAGCSLLLVVVLLLWAYDNSRPLHEPGVLKQFIARHFR